MPKPYVVLLGKATRAIMRLRGGGSALPGLFVEKIDPDFVRRVLHQLPQGVVLISGTNGKTTTTKMVVELLEASGLRVFTNRTGSNFTRGVAAALIGDVDLHEKLSADIAVLELDEAHAVHFVKNVPPRYSLLLNVMRDQLDRFGEIDYTASLLEKIADATTEKVIVNREDSRLAALGANLASEKVAYYGLGESLREVFPNDDDMRSQPSSLTGDLSFPATDADVVLESLDGNNALLSIRQKSYRVALKLNGLYNVFNAAGALALVVNIQVENVEIEKLIHKLSTITPAFGRGEIITIGGQPLELVLVKNPGGFRLGLQSFSPNTYATMIAINDNYADGRDMSWLWDVDFESLKTTGVSVASGIRAYDMALRLQYDEVTVGSVETDLVSALRSFIAKNTDSPKRIYCTYTAMLALRKELGKITKVEVIS